ncbi:lipid A-modifier LpxR family protein [Ruixingdingia sedimenti]|uniref:DUF2219 family protein n=1 Tax=Ruixingdingia sedimenti TaxID=3073604 RepID=A0ABU1FDE6_9RHOB|nr:lipid A-modifier LpxR family protein [Xinfangfangia sp. LG-4]MDR5654912.1 DUF2219 family protein [Xinfangfangia sp. LG-4]
MPRAFLQLARAAFGAALFTATLSPAAAMAQDRQVLGHGRLFSNDFIGDGHDRWRSGAYVVSRVTGPEWQGHLPSEFGAIREYRFRSEIIQPRSLTNPGPRDRRYAGVLSAGVHTHLALGRAEASVGADLVMVGPQTLVGRFQRGAHQMLGHDRPMVLGNQIGNRLLPTLSGEVGLPLVLADGVSLRPFVEGQAGAETYLRAGADMVVGRFGEGGLMLRDVGTGQRYRGVPGATVPGLSFVLGADVAHVTHSAFLPDGGAATLSDERTRLRAGLHWQGRRSDLFYGVTRLGREFEEQPEGQVIGSLRLRIRF